MKLNHEEGTPQDSSMVGWHERDVKEEIAIEQQEAARAEDLTAYFSMKDAIVTSATSAVKEIEKDASLKELYEKVKEGDEDAEIAVGRMKKTDPEKYALIMKPFLLDYINDLHEYIKKYVACVNAVKLHMKRHTGNYDEEIKSETERLDQNRTQAHDALIIELKMIIGACENGGIDTSWKCVLGFRMGQEYRQDVQRWAENVSDYLVTVSKTTL